MAKREISNIGLSNDIIIEVIRTKGDEVVKKEMTVGEWRVLKKQSGYVYRAFQKGFSKYNIP